jgi:hypothetical protein
MFPREIRQCDELAEFEIFDSDNEEKHLTEVAKFVTKKMGDAFAAGIFDEVLKPVSTPRRSTRTAPPSWSRC